MKQIFAILMLGVQLFNLYGYTFVFNYQIDQSGIEANRQADADAYADAELVEMKVSLNLPYMSEWPEYERFEGSVEIEGIFYNYVKRKIVKDTLYVLCIPNSKITALSQLKQEYGMQANDLSANQKGKDTSGKKYTPVTEFTIHYCCYDFAVGTTSIQLLYHSTDSRPLIGYPHVAGQPPQFLPA